MSTVTKVLPLPITLTCLHCLEEQVVHIRARTGGLRQIEILTVPCVKCGRDVITPEQVIAGPFLP